MTVPYYRGSPEQMPCDLFLCRSQDIDFGDELYNDGDANSDVASTAHVSQSNQTQYWSVQHAAVAVSIALRWSCVGQTLFRG